MFWLAGRPVACQSDRHLLGQGFFAALVAYPTRDNLVPELALFGSATWAELIAKPHRMIYRAANVCCIGRREK